jgi:hypothetical protein
MVAGAGTTAYGGYIFNNATRNMAADKKKANNRVTTEHTSGQRPSTENKHEAGQARKKKEQARADESYSKTKSTKPKAKPSNNDKKKNNPEYKRTGPKKEN